MSGWSTLNVAYDGDWEEPDLFLRDITGKPHPHDGFDYLMYAYTSDDRALQLFREIAAEHGDPEFLVQVTGDDTSMYFTVEQVTVEGETIETWDRVFRDDPDTFAEKESWNACMDRIGDETGYRPSLGGNFE